MTARLPLASLLILGSLFLAPPALAQEAPAAKATGATGALERYLARPQPKFAWKVKKIQDMGEGLEIARLSLVSQEWQGITWKHRLNVVIPPAAKGKRARPGHAALVITGGGREEDLLIFMEGLARKLGVPVAVLHDVPNQPLFRKETGRKLKEDSLIAYTFVRFMETGDESWPCLFPMVRSAVAAMDALSEFSETMKARSVKRWEHGKLERFVTSGASKRGWTTWLSAVADQRVIGIAPIVYDNLNVGKQIELHYKTFGGPSPSIHDYTDAGLLDFMKTERGKKLIRMVDPYSYRERITVPKMALIGTNDTYWPLESIHLYAHDLPGHLYTHYVPNAGHSAGLSVIQAVGGFFDYVTKRTAALPRARMTILPRRSAEIRVVEQAERVLKVRLWGSHVTGRDFTKSKWTRVEAKRTSTGWTAELPKATRGESGRAAFIAEMELEDSSGTSFVIHTKVQVWDLGPRARE